jgi:hypothetical protein
MGNGSDVTDVQLIDEDICLRPGDIIDFIETGQRGILVESRYTSSAYIEEEPFDNFYIFNRRRNDQIKIWKIFWFRQKSGEPYNVGYYSDKALVISINRGDVDLRRK